MRYILNLNNKVLFWVSLCIVTIIINTSILYLSLNYIFSVNPILCEKSDVRGVTSMEVFDLSEKYKPPKYEDIMGFKTKKGWITFIAGYSGSGKTHFLTSCVKDAFGKKVFFSLELPKEEIHSAFMRTFNDEERRESIKDLLIIVCKGLKLTQLEKRLEEIKSHGKHLDWVFIDDPQRIVDDTRQDLKGQKKYLNEESVLHKLDILAEKYNVGIFLTKQISGEGRENPSMDKVKGASYAVDISDVFIILTEEGTYKIDKSRAGQQGKWRTWRKVEDMEKDDVLTSDERQFINDEYSQEEKSEIKRQQTTILDKDENPF